MNITVEAQYKLGYRDSIEMKDSVMVFNEWIIKGNRRGIRRTLPDYHDTARYRVARVAALMHADANKNPVRLSEGADFEITADGWLKWLGRSRDIADGTPFSIHYEFHPVWVITSHPHALRDTVTTFKKPGETIEGLPLQAVGQLDYLLDISNANGAVIPPAPVTGGC
jgi:hypothetical protein